jgi:hypothetical protein
VIIQGRVLQVGTVSGANNDGSQYSYVQAHILDGLEVIRARVADDYGPIAEGEDVTAVCRVNPYVDRRGGGARLSVSLVAPYALASRAAA